MTGNVCARLHCSHFARQAGLESGPSTQLGDTQRESTVPLLPVLCTLDFDNRSLCARLPYQQWGSTQGKLRVAGPGDSKDGDRFSDIVATPRVLLGSRAVHRDLRKIR